MFFYQHIWTVTSPKISTRRFPVNENGKLAQSSLGEYSMVYGRFTL